MKIVIKKSVFKAVLSRLHGENVLIRSAGKGRVEICGADSFGGYYGFHPAEVSGEGAVLVSLKKLYKITQEHPEDELEIVAKDWKRIFIEGNDLSYVLLGLNPDEFTNPPIATKPDEMVAIQERDLRKMIEKSCIVSSPSDYRAHVVGTNVGIVRNDSVTEFVMQSTDSSRLHESKTILSSGLGAGKWALVPKKRLKEVSRFLTGSDIVHVGYFANFIVFERGDEVFYTRILEGEFPEVSRLFEKREDEIVVVANRERFMSMLRRVSIFASEDDQHVMLYTTDNGKISVEVKNASMGNAKEAMTADVRGGSIETKFNPQYLIDLLSVVDGESVMFSLSGEHNASIWYDDDDPGFTGVVMPLMQ